MSNEAWTDFKPGDAPVPVGVVVEFRGRDYEVEEHITPRPSTPDPKENYPDGVAYVLWPVGVAKKFGNRDQSVVQVRRTSFRVKTVDQTKEC
ncbi:hypothetical protein [Streptomyces sp. NPDC059761]|uniref:hypothetical protein n=1 Tax=Streptomyces sp. NPDC059761 TaxID=3346937 RepID=UPI00365CEBF4